MMNNLGLYKITDADGKTTYVLATSMKDSLHNADTVVSCVRLEMLYTKEALYEMYEMKNPAVIGGR